MKFALYSFLFLFRNREDTFFFCTVILNDFVFFYCYALIVSAFIFLLAFLLQGYVLPYSDKQDS